MMCGASSATTRQRCTHGGTTHSLTQIRSTKPANAGGAASATVFA
jgi:hypothetical protein